MTNIDWTKPVETTEDPPRPVRVDCGKSMVEVMADLAAARAALRGASTIIMRPSWYESHDTAIAAARAEKEKTND